MILKFLWDILYPEPIPTTKMMEWFHIDKHYDDMNRREKREYKRWLEKHDYWDGAIVIENLAREQKLRMDEYTRKDSTTKGGLL
jgi:hypothetical protein